MTQLRGLYAIIDPECCAGRDPIWVADAVLRGGCALMQLRAKRATDREILRLGAALRDRCRARAVPFVLNDRADLAALLGADGLHLGQDDLPIAEARRLFTGPIGRSTHDAMQARASVGLADIIGVGPVFATRSKENAGPQLGISMLREICRESPIPTVAIGGITLDNARLAFDAGADMVAMISALSHADAPHTVAARVQEMGATAAGTMISEGAR
jgi:thiamine-phosphate diphosphorylase